MSKLEQKLKSLSNDQLIQLSEELRLTSVAPDALLREVIKDTELDTTAPMLAFVGVGQMLAHVLADRLIVAENEKKEHIDRLQNAGYKRDAIDMG